MNSLSENPSESTEHIGFDEGKMREALKLFFRNLPGCPPDMEFDEKSIQEGLQWLRPLMQTKDSYGVLETRMAEDGSRIVVGAINAHNALYEMHGEDQPSKIPPSALARMGAQKNEVYYVDTIATEKEFEGTGIASKMLSDVENFARSRGFTWIFLRTDDDAGNSEHPNHAVCKFYRSSKRGYTEFGKLEDGKATKTHFAKKLQSDVASQRATTSSAVCDLVDL